MSYPFWMGNQFKFDPAVFPGYNTSQPPAPPGTSSDSLFGRPSLFGSLPGGGDGATSAPGPAGPQDPTNSPPSLSQIGNTGKLGDFAGFTAGMLGGPVAGYGVGSLGRAAAISQANAFLSNLTQNVNPPEISFLNALNPFFSAEGSATNLGSFFGDDPSTFSTQFADNDAFSFGTDAAGADEGDTGVSAETGQAAAAADAAAAAAGSPSSSDDGGSTGVGSGDAYGGYVGPEDVYGPDPAGLDEGYRAVRSGEYVLRPEAVKKLGVKNLAKLNAGEFDKKTLMKALKAKNPKIRVAPKKPPSA